MRESELRSLDRQRMYTIFSPLDANEPLPRELLMDARRHRVLGRRELAGVLWLPALVVAVYVAGVVNVSGVALVRLPICSEKLFKFQTPEPVTRTVASGLICSLASRIS